MKRIITLCFSTLLYLGLQAQAPANKTVYDCNGNSKNIYNTLGTGKAIIVAHKGVDCSICVNSAPGWQTWAAANTNKVEVWGAITYTYNPSQFTMANMCQKTLQWKATHSWNDIFTFPDSTRLWVNGGSPRYYVYSPIDSSIVYQGPNFNTARTTALAQSVVGLSAANLETSKFFVNAKQLTVESKGTLINTISVFQINGQLAYEENVNTTATKIDLSNLGSGTFIVQLKGANNEINNKKVILH